MLLDWCSIGATIWLQLLIKGRQTLQSGPHIANQGLVTKQITIQLN